MLFIRTQKLVYDKAGRIVSGSASIIDVTYNPEGEKYKSKQTVRERIGRVVEMYGKRKDFFNLQPEVLWFTMLMPMLSHLHR